jgi:hypothetical protein
VLAELRHWRIHRDVAVWLSLLLLLLMHYGRVDHLRGHGRRSWRLNGQRRRWVSLVGLVALVLVLHLCRGRLSARRGWWWSRHLVVLFFFLAMFTLWVT